MEIDRIYRQEVFVIGPMDPLTEAARRMRANDISAMMVLDEAKFVGIITERDLTRAILAEDQPSSAIVADYMTDHSVMIGPRTGVREAAAEMLELDVRHLPVGEAGDVTGMVSLRDLLSVVVECADL
jgi:signal-transduction protein with cAMP-binding, CBS, and nucleotidyltransferase domain